MKEIPPIPDNIDILVNNVGGMGRCIEEDYFEAMKKNYGIAENLTMQFIHQFFSSNRFSSSSLPIRFKGKVITIASIFGKEAGTNPGFTAAKAAEIAFMKSMANKHAHITFNTICPGYIDVNKSFGISVDPRFVGKPKDIAKLASFLASEDTNFISGACIVVDGGFTVSY
jgi:3-oxoacyl-[acyl-carrier protein] reductase